MSESTSATKGVSLTRRVRAVLGLALLCGGCASATGSTHGAEQAAVGESTGDAGLAAARIVLTLDGPGARDYGNPTTPPLKPSEVERALLTAIDRIRPTPRPSLDPRLSAAARQIAAWAPRTGRLPYGAVELALHHQGIVEPTPALILLWSEPGAGAMTAASLAEHLAEPLAAELAPLFAARPYHRAGIGQVVRDDQSVATVGLVLASALELKPMPRLYASGGKASLAARVDSVYSALELFVTRPSGEVVDVAVAASPGAFFSRRIDCTADGVHRVEIVGRDASGPSVLANFPIYCGVAAPRSAAFANGTTARRPNNDPEAIEAELIRLINGARKEHGLPALAPHAPSRPVARAWAAQMADSGEVVHETRDAGSAMDRLRAAGVHVARVHENLARAGNAAEVHDGLMASPGHRRNILAPQATHVAVGAVVRPGRGVEEVFVTELFVRVPPPLRAAEAKAIIGKALLAQKLSIAPALNAVAERQLGAVLAGKAHGAAVGESQTGADVRGYARLRSVSLVLADLGELDATTLVAAGLSHSGFAFRQAEHPELGPGAIFLVIVLGEPR